VASGARSSWNHNTHFHPFVLRGLPPGATALDVGSGEGLLTRQMLAAGAGHVTGLDASGPMVELARALCLGEPRSADLDYVVADVRAAAARSLPGSTFRSRLYWRYTIEWRAPA
jgi:2-polyprenyl-3-methyl-5-hydroxy-6-metoxy-1,4-benzoquinol methylase